jgi:L-ornithine N5-oxygenase
VGGKAVIPKVFQQNHNKVVHSSQYSIRVGEVLPDRLKPYNIAVVGSGQSAAEIYNDLPSRYPNAKVTLVVKGSALRPSDDSPFVNEIFDPDRVDGLYRQGADARAKAIVMDRATNYGVVRLDLLERLYEHLYIQRIRTPNPDDWKVLIKSNTEVVKTDTVVVAGEEKLLLRLNKLRGDGSVGSESEDMTVDAVFSATGYIRNTHESLLRNTGDLLRHFHQAGRAKFPVRRDYKIDFDEEKVAESAGVWLQGCNESTHGVSSQIFLPSSANDVCLVE